jgi:menaquinol-cytochrome c reductase cytochrome b/c subunit
MAREDTPLDQETFDRVLAEELAKGTAQRVAEGRARSAAVRALRAKEGGGAPAAAAPAEPAEGPAAAPSAAPSAAPVAAAAPAAAPAAAAPTPAPAAPAPAGAAAAVAVAPASTTAPTREAPLPTGNLPTPKKGAPEKHRLLALVPPEGIQRVEREQGDRVNTWPHLLIEEFVAMLILFAGMLIFSTFVNAPLREVANANLTPNPSKAPWYFLGLQELLRYFHPLVAGISIPTFILVGLAAVPYVDRNPSVKPGDRKIAITMFTLLFMFGATLTIIGSFFRGPGYNWVWPWAQGVFFEL